MIQLTFNTLDEMMGFFADLMGASEKNEAEPATVVPAAIVQAEPSQAVTAQAAPEGNATQGPVLSEAQSMVPTASGEYSLDDLARASVGLMDAGRQGELQALLSNFGVSALPQLAKDQYGAFATALRGMGARI